MWALEGSARGGISMGGAQYAAGEGRRACCCSPSSEGEAWSGPVSRILFPGRLHGRGEDHSSAARVTAAVEQPTRTLERTRAGPLRPYLVLLRRGFAMPSTLTCDAVRSYRTVSPLPRRSRDCSLEWRSAVCFLLHCSVASPRLAVSQPAARRSSDFPRLAARSSGPLHAGQHNSGRQKNFPGADMKTIEINCCSFNDLERMSAGRHQNFIRFVSSLK